MTFNLRYISIKLAEKGYSKKEVEEVGNAVFDMVRQTAKSGDRKNYKFKNVRLFNFGTFAVKEGRIKYLKKLNGNI